MDYNLYKCMPRSRIPNKRKLRKKSANYSPFDWRKFLFVLILLGFVGVVSWVFLTLPIAQIVDVEVSGTDRIQDGEVAQIVKAELSGKYWEQISKSQFVVVRANKVADKIYSEFGAVREVAVHKVFPNKLEVEILEWERIYLWCVGGSEDCRLLEITDRGAVTGRIVKPEEKLLSDNPVTRIIDTGGRRTNFGAAVYDFAQFEFVKNLADELADIEVKIGDAADDDASNPDNMKKHGNITLTTPSRVSGYLQVTTTEGWEVLVHTGQVLSTVINTLRATLEQIISSEERGNIQYIDLRVNNKAIYKLKNLTKVDANKSSKVLSELSNGSE